MRSSSSSFSMPQVHPDVLPSASSFGLNPKHSRASARTRFAFMCALTVVQVANVGGSVYLKAAMANGHAPHSIVFALYRELLAGSMLLIAATVLHQTALRRADALAVAALGACLFGNQVAYILGLQLAGVTLAACMQPSIPVFTVVISMAVGQEASSLARLAGTPAAQTVHSKNEICVRVARLSKGTSMSAFARCQRACQMCSRTDIQNALTAHTAAITTREQNGAMWLQVRYWRQQGLSSWCMERRTRGGQSQSLRLMLRSLGCPRICWAPSACWVTAQLWRCTSSSRGACPANIHRYV